MSKVQVYYIGRDASAQNGKRLMYLLGRLENNGLGTFTERLSNLALQTSKAVKNSTSLSKGTVSVAFAAVQYIIDTVVS